MWVNIPETVSHDGKSYIVTQIGWYAFGQQFGANEVILPNTVTTIEDWAFRYCYDLRSVTIPASLQKIGNDAFVYAGGDGKQINLSDLRAWCNVDIQSGYSSPFHSWGHLFLNGVEVFNLVIPEGVKILKHTFNGCGFITSISIPSSLEKIGDGTFAGCHSVNDIFCWVSNPMTLTLASDAFNDINSNCTLHVPEGSKSLYASANVWKKFNIVEMDENGNDIIIVQSITLTPSQLNINKGGQAQLSYEITPDNAYNKNVIWKTSDENVARVDTNGLVTAISNGEAVITCSSTDGTNISASCIVKVLTMVSSVQFNKETTSFFIGDGDKLDATVLPTDATIKTLHWTSSNPDVAIVDETGFVTSQSIGSATITATTTDGSNISASCEVVVKGIDYIELDKDELVIFKGDTETLVATYEPLDVIINTLTWRSSNSNIVTVDNNGNITAKAAGTATITVSTTDGSNLSASCEVTVLPLYGLQLDKSLSHTRGAQPEVVELSIDMSNKEDISGIQFDLYLPEGVTLAYLDGLPDVWLDDARRGRNHSVEVGQTAYGYRVLVSSPTNRVFSGHTGDVLHMNVIMSQYHPIGNYYIRLNNIVLAEPDETQHWPSNASTNVKLSYLVGDADADVSVDVADYTLTALHILARNPENFYIDAANVNNDNYINVADLVGITNIGLGIRPQELRQVKGHDAGHSTQQAGTAIHISGHQPACSQLAIALSSDRALAGFQCDLDLPTVVSIKKMEILGRAAKHQLSANTLQGGMMRILVSAFSDQDIEPGDDDILLITLDGEADGVARLTNILGVERDMTTHKIDDATIDLNATGVNLLNTLDHARIYVEDDRVVIESQHSGTAQLVRVNGITIPLQVHQGRNVYRLDAGFYMVHFEGQTAKILIQ